MKMRVPIRKPDRYTHVKPDPQMTEEKRAELERALQRLLDIRPKVAEEVKFMSETGDFSENAGYQAVKARLRGINQRILELEEQLKHAKVIARPVDASTVQLGHRVTVTIEGKQHTFRILGSSETNPGAGVISHSSPIGSALMGRRAGETVTFRVGTTTRSCTIVRIE